MIIGIIGQSGSGKDTLADCLVSSHGFEHISVSNHLRFLAKQHFSYDLSRVELSEFADKLRVEYGPTHLLDICISTRTKQNLVLSGIYAREETEKITSLGGVVVAVSAPDNIRYQRVLQRSNARDLTVGDFKEFQIQSTKELDVGAYTGRASVGDATIMIINDCSHQALQKKITRLVETIST